MGYRTGPVRQLLLGRGVVPEPLRTALGVEQPVVLAEGLRGSITYVGDRGTVAQGERLWTTWHREMIVGGLAVTARRAVLIVGNHKHGDVPFDHPLFSTLDIRCDRADRLVVAYDASLFRSDRRGRVEVRLRTPDAPRLAQLIVGHRTPNPT